MSKIPFFEEADQYLFFEPKPITKYSESSLEGCLNYASKIETLREKNNLYLCE